MEIIKLYEPASTDGYSHIGDNIYFLEESLAKICGKNKHGNYTCGPISHLAVEIEEGKYLRVISDKPITIVNSNAAKVEIKKKALDKLTKEERDVLGLS